MSTRPFWGVRLTEQRSGRPLHVYVSDKVLVSDVSCCLVGVPVNKE